jgi:hypothetical protein
MTNTISEGPAFDPLLFPKDDYAVETKTVKTSAGEMTVTYHSYMHIPYVANPVDTEYQSLNVSVPIRVDDVPVDATNAPILFANDVGGYMSASNVRPRRMGGRPPRGNRNVSSKPDLALAAGYVVVSPGCRGRDNQAEDGTYYGKAPAAIVDLKAAVRYIRHNKGVIPGNVDWIVSSGCSAGGALSSLLGACGNSPLYDAYLQEIGAADADDSIYASACFSPIIDLEHADMAYEWTYGAVPTRSGSLVDQELSEQLKALFADYQASLGLQGEGDFGVLTADDYDQYLLQYYLLPSANKYLNALEDDERNAYLANNPWIIWNGHSATFTFADYVAHTGRMKGLPAFDDLEMTKPEPSLFGNKTTEARHYTHFSLRQATGNDSAEIDSDLQMVVNLMNPMYFIGQNNIGCAQYWWLRHGTQESGSSQTTFVNLAVSLASRHKDVNAWLYWGAEHCVDDDPEGLIVWIGNITGFFEHSHAGK